MNFKIVSGGQTGVDRAALTYAIEHGIPHGGWCPKGRAAEHGETIPLDFKLTETPSSDFSERTKWNIRDSDGTLIILPDDSKSIKDGTILTESYAKEISKPLFIINLLQETHIEALQDWIISNRITTLNVAGPRESSSKGIYKKSLALFEKIMPAIEACQSKITEKQLRCRL